MFRMSILSKRGSGRNKKEEAEYPRHFSVLLVWKGELLLTLGSIGLTPGPYSHWTECGLFLLPWFAFVVEHTRRAQRGHSQGNGKRFLSNCTKWLCPVQRAIPTSTRDVVVPARSWRVDREQRNHISRCLFVWGKQPITRSVLGRILGSMHGNTTPQRLSGCIGIGTGGTQPWSTRMTRKVPKERTYNGGVREQKRGDRGSSRLRVHVHDRDGGNWGNHSNQESIYYNIISSSYGPCPVLTNLVVLCERV